MVEGQRLAMGWFEMLEYKLIMLFRTYEFSFWNSLGKICHQLCQASLICTLDLVYLLSVKESDKSWNSRNIKCSSNISCLMCITTCEYKIWIFIRSSQTFKSWFYHVTRTATRAPKIDNKSWMIFKNFLKLRHTTNFTNSTRFWFRIRKLGCLTHTSTSSTHVFEEILCHCRIYAILLHHLLSLRALKHVCCIWIIQQVSCSRWETSW